MKREKLYISSIASDASETARSMGFGFEIAQFCDSTRLDDDMPALNAEVGASVEGIEKRILHAPFSELFPCAIDGRIREIAARRYLGAVSSAQRFGANKVVIHAGFNPSIYYPVWFHEKSVLFWQTFMKGLPEGLMVCLENVLEPEPQMIFDIVEAVGDERLRICLDIGHVNAYSRIPAEKWLEKCAPYISHFHIHNNDGSWDYHNALPDGSLDMKSLLYMAEELCPEATFTMEVLEAVPSVRWLEKEGII